MKILIVEDISIIQFHIKEVVNSIAHEIIAAVKSGEEAIDVCNENKPDLILMDIGLKGELNGIETAQKILNLHPEIHLVYLSGNSDLLLKEEALNTQPEAFIIKPVIDNELINIIQSIDSKLEGITIAG